MLFYLKPALSFEVLYIMRKLHYKVPKNKKEAIRFVYTLDSEWDKCFEIKNKRERCKAILRVHKAALECRDSMKTKEDSYDLKRAISIIEKWLNAHRLSRI